MNLNTPNLDLPYIAPGQSQKHVTHNEAIRALDALVQLTIRDIASTPPASPVEGERLIVGDTPTAAFIGHENEIAAWQDGAWMFYPPQTGWTSHNQDDGTDYRFDGAVWNPIGFSVNPVDLVGVNATADAQNRLSVKSDASLFDHDGESHQMKINKASASDNASLLFQNDYMGHAEIGLAGNNDLHAKVSSDGMTFKDSLVAHATSGAVSLPYGFDPAQLAPTTPDCGGPSERYGPPNLVTVCYGQGTLGLVKDRIYFLAAYVDRHTTLTGGFVSMPSASAASGAVLRCGLYELGTQSGGAWLPGNLVADFGTVAANTTGNKIITLGTPIDLSPGWYAFVIGASEDGVAVNFMRALTPGLVQLQPFGTGAGADIRTAGAAIYLFTNGAGTEITAGLPSDWSAHSVQDISSPNSHQYMAFIPKHVRWEGAS